MLTKAHLDFFVRKGKVRPRLLDPKDTGLHALAEDLIEIVHSAMGATMGELEEALEARAKAHKYIKQSRGLVKLLLDRVEVEEPEGEALERRTDVFRNAAAVFQGLEDDTSFEAYERQVEAALDRPLGDVRADLYADLPHRRKVLEWKPYEPLPLLHRYNLAQAQGLLYDAKRLEVSAPKADLAVARRILRWLKFCRLVADVSHTDDLWIGVEGPAALFSSGKKYGLQLASFLAAVPLLKVYEVTADIDLKGRPPLTLSLSQKDKLVSYLTSGIGHVPPEVSRVVDKLQDEAEWTIELTPQVRNVGVKGTCVPDLTFVHKTGGQEIAVELFHASHKGALGRRLEELEAKPDPHLFLGVDRSLAKGGDWGEHPQVFLFNAFPAVRTLREILKRFE